MEDKELIWVSKDLAKKYKEVENDESKRAEQVKIINDYINSLSQSSRDDFKSSLECLEEDVAIYKGLMLNVKQAFEKAKNESLNASYELWEKYQEELPSVEEKTKEIISKLQPLKKELLEINDLIGKIRTWNIDKLKSSIHEIADLYGREKEMVSFLIDNFKEK